ncbi:MAG: 4-hydroxythreonine-4-phosphate dehydrogenase PdxA [Gemmatimonadota bacterium]|nr:4-hydroxythreonine-4-phosphate dehydrogenase PdxA [Gemmatimonadota bacterium]MDH3366463.1 4-hydroxythreonine-4-phosphate dehydrogenase PdxA [Gemmatimonadota bacterium]MDH3479098.1 4-hydroxythreonine-4-phosphate dehydrogenase PdxA [Gemmatimonadota bacterium]MDH3568698.1 4-hydroxythreonine-4-phosphate dehydrogenase PdxA [Gemmatimonadota bacterium]MDH5549205.1 4-hydroxythreonine-4-phosphate dehydrogenase PdxA [Gemmatimonadota bacterium]
MLPRVAITVGDPRGIGPEVVTKALADPPPDADWMVIGPEALLETIPADRRIPIPSRFPPPASPFTLPLSPHQAGLCVKHSVEEAVRLAMAGDVDAIVTGPAEKRALHLAGVGHPGHTEWLADLAGGVDVAMMLVAGGLRVVLVTTHLPLREVPGAVTLERVLATARLARSALERWWDVRAPRLAICALNPHAGEDGLFGSEDAEILAPAARALGATGPLPADTVFVRALRGEFDVVVVPYHDVAMTAVKLAGFGSGVNITLGLPFVRTAPDHGTAMDIAGKGVADPGSMREAVKLAVELGRRAIG